MSDPHTSADGQDHGHDPDHDRPHRPPRTAEEWDRRYAERGQVWSGRANPNLVAEASRLEPGRALDVACGEGGDAVWLAEHGWQVTATDISRVGIDRGREAATERGVEVEWLVADIADGPPREAGYDLVTAHYAALSHDDDDAAARGIIAAVAPGGLLLYVGHASADGSAAHVGGQDASERLQPADLAALLGDGWQVEVLENRPHGDGEHARHPFDSVLRARRAQA